MDEPELSLRSKLFLYRYPEVRAEVDRLRAEVKALRTQGHVISGDQVLDLPDGSVVMRTGYPPGSVMPETIFGRHPELFPAHMHWHVLYVAEVT